MLQYISLWFHRLLLLYAMIRSQYPRETHITFDTSTLMCGAEHIPNKVDIFIVAHFIGWILKSLMFRNRMFCWFLSILFETVEYSLSSTMTNFKECWWDRWVFDILLCNGLGIEMGHWILRKFKIKNIDWWNNIHAYKCVFIIVPMMYGEVNGFVFRNILNLRNSHPFHILRLAVMAISVFGIPMRYSQGKLRPLDFVAMAQYTLGEYAVLKLADCERTMDHTTPDVNAVYLWSFLFLVLLSARVTKTSAVNTFMCTALCMTTYLVSN